MADIATLSVLLRVDDQLTGALARSKAQLQQTGAAATGTGHAMHGMAGQTKNAWMESMMLGMHVGATGKTLVALGAPLAAIGGLSIKAFTDFESSFAGIRKTVDATEEQFGELQAGLRRMALEIPVNVNELNRIGEAAGQLGVKVENIESFTRTMADLGVTTNMSSDQAATALARLANITGLPQKEVGRLGSTIVELGNNLATTEAELVDFGLRIAGAGTIAGLTEAQILAIGGAMASVGVQAEAGGTAVQKVLLAMTEQVATGGEQLEVFAATAGMTAARFSKAFEEDAAGAFTAFVEGLGTAGTDAFAILAELGLEDQRLMRSFLSLAGAGDLLRNSIEMGTGAFADNTALTEEARKRYQTAESQFILLKNSLQEVAITIGLALIPPLLTLIENVRPVLAGIGEWISANPGLTQGLILVAGATTVLGTGLVALGLIIPGITGLVVGLTAAYGFLTSVTTLSMVAMLKWIAVPLLAVASIQSLLNQLDNLWFALQGKGERKETGILELLGDDLQALVGITGDAISAMLGLDNVASAFTEGSATDMEEEIKRIVEEITNLIGGLPGLNREFHQTEAAAESAASAYLDLAARMEAMGRPMEDLLPLAMRLKEEWGVDLPEAINMLAETLNGKLDTELQDAIRGFLGLGDTVKNTRTWTEPASSAYLDLAARLEAMGRPMEDLLPLAQRLADAFAIDLGDAIDLLAKDRLDMLDAELRDAVEGMRALGDEAERTADAVAESFARMKFAELQREIGGLEMGPSGERQPELREIRGLQSILGTGFYETLSIQTALRGALGLGAAQAGALALPLVEILRAVEDLREAILLPSGAMVPLDALISLLRERWELPSFQGGGIVPGGLGQPVPILAHGGEIVSPHGRGGQTLVFNTTINGPVYGITDLEQQVAQIWRDTAMAGGFRGLI